jgi:hypothetical protein
MKALCQYGTTREIVEIGNIVLGSCVELGLWGKATKLFELIFHISPKALSSLVSPIITTKGNRKERNVSIPKHKKEEIGIQNFLMYIMEICDSIICL